MSKRALIIQGTSGSGKTTVARKIATKHNMCYLEHDYFIFALQPYRPVTDEHLSLGNELHWLCFKKAVEAGKSVVLEGVMTPHGALEFDFNLDNYFKLLIENGYTISRAFLTCTYEMARSRMERREVWDGHENIVPEDLYQSLLNTLNTYVPKSVLKIDTATLTEDEVYARVVKCID